MPEDSISDLTDLEEEEILAKYLKKTRTKDQKLKKEQAKGRAEAQKRLMGEVINNRHVCRDHKVLTEDEKQARAHEDTIVLELRNPERKTKMMDEDQSAHQFSVREASAQADSEERMDIEMRASIRESKMLRSR